MHDSCSFPPAGLQLIRPGTHRPRDRVRSLAAIISAALVLVLLALVLSLVAGCDEDVTAVVGTDLPFTVYGLLTPDLDVQKVLVYPIEGTLQPRGAEPLDAVVRSVDLDSGEDHLWRDSLVVDSLGLYEHVFVADFTAEYDHTYRLSITRADGRETTVQTTVPPRTDIRTGAPTVFPGVVTLPAIVQGGAPRVLKPVVVYFVTYKVLLDQPTQLDVRVDYSGKQQLTDEGWVIPIDLAGDFKTIERAVVTKEFAEVDRTFGIRLDAIRLQLIVASDEWNPPNGVFDPEIIVQPGTMSNVENGYGFLAAGYRHNRALPLPHADVLSAAGFAAPTH